jgi:hypothetical protein
MACRENLAKKESQDEMVDLVFLDYKVHLDHRVVVKVHQDHRGHPDQEAIEGRLVQKEWTVSQVNRAQKVCQDKKEALVCQVDQALKDCQVKKETKVKQDLLACRDHKAQEDILE